MTSLSKEIKDIKKDVESLKNATTSSGSTEVFDAIIVAAHERCGVIDTLSDPVFRDRIPVCGETTIAGFFEGVSEE